MRQPDLLLLNDGDLSYTKIRFDERSLATVRESLPTLDDSLARALCWGALWDMARDAELSPADLVDIVLRGLGSETNGTAVRMLPMYVQVAIDQLAHPDRRVELRVTWEAGMRRLLEEAAPGSDHQLTFVRSFAGVAGKRIPPSSYGGAARSSEGLDFLEGLLDGTVSLAGLEVAKDLRWQALTALAAHGRADQARVAGELELDHTISGRERAAAALAVIPSPETKAAAWHEATLSDQVSNETQRSIAYVFDVSGQDASLDGYVEKYLSVADTIWGDQGTQIASTMLEYMFPRSLTGSDTLALVETWLKTSPADPAAKGHVRDVRDDLVRALAAQEADGRRG